MKRKQEHINALLIASLQLHKVHAVFHSFKCETIFNSHTLDFEHTYQTNYLFALTSEQQATRLIGSHSFPQRFKKYAHSVVQLCHFLKLQSLPGYHIEALQLCEIYILRLLTNQLPQSKQLELITINLPTFQ